MAETLPEGTDNVIDGAGVSGASEATVESVGAGGGEGGARKPAGDWQSLLTDRLQGLRAQATDQAREYTIQGRDRVTSALDDLVKIVEEAADQVDEKIGAQYGDQVRRASGAVAGFADTLRDQDADQLFEQATDLLRKSPAVAVGAAATLGFVVARIIKASSGSFGGQTGPKA